MMESILASDLGLICFQEDSFLLSTTQKGVIETNLERMKEFLRKQMKLESFSIQEVQEVILLIEITYPQLEETLQRELSSHEAGRGEELLLLKTKRMRDMEFLKKSYQKLTLPVMTQNLHTRFYQKTDSTQIISILANSGYCESLSLLLLLSKRDRYVILNDMNLLSRHYNQTDSAQFLFLKMRYTFEKAFQILGPYLMIQLIDMDSHFRRIRENLIQDAIQRNHYIADKFKTTKCQRRTCQCRECHLEKFLVKSSLTTRHSHNVDIEYKRKKDYYIKFRRCVSLFLFQHFKVVL